MDLWPKLVVATARLKCYGHGPSDHTAPPLDAVAVRPLLQRRQDGRCYSGETEDASAEN